MKIMIALAETAAMHPDGTFSLLRGGIDRVWAPQIPVTLRGTLLVLFHADPVESGDHSWRICVVDEDGKRIVPQDLEGRMTVPPKGRTGHILIPFQLPFPKYGAYSFRVALDGAYEDEWPLEVKKPKDGASDAPGGPEGQA